MASPGETRSQFYVDLAVIDFEMKYMMVPVVAARAHAIEQGWIHSGISQVKRGIRTDRSERQQIFYSVLREDPEYYKLNIGAIAPLMALNEVKPVLSFSTEVAVAEGTLTVEIDSPMFPLLSVFHVEHIDCDMTFAPSARYEKPRSLHVRHGVSDAGLSYRMIELVRGREILPYNIDDSVARKSTASLSRGLELFGWSGLQAQALLAFDYAGIERWINAVVGDQKLKQLQAKPLVDILSAVSDIFAGERDAG